jgi:hypothetical protein
MPAGWLQQMTQLHPPSATKQVDWKMPKHSVEAAMDVCRLLERERRDHDNLYTYVKEWLLCIPTHQRNEKYHSDTNLRFQLLQKTLNEVQNLCLDVACPDKKRRLIYIEDVLRSALYSLI